MASKLRLRARGTAHVQDHEALAVGMRRFIGRRLCEVVAGVGVPGTDNHQPPRHAFVDMEEVVEKSASSEFAALYLEDIAVGALWAGDEETAKLAEEVRKSRHPNLPAVEFDPLFGEEPAPSPMSSRVEKALSDSPIAPKAS